MRSVTSSIHRALPDAPKGVAVNQSNICQFLKSCDPIYGVTAADRVYQGMTLAFDFSIEEIWPTFKAGATLVAGPNDHRRFGTGLNDFLIEQRISVICCVPTLLATLENNVPSLRLLLVGGEACPADLVKRWSRPGRRMLNTYGPTEATVTATWCELLPDRPVTIGKPLPGSTIYILDDEPSASFAGGEGEICIGGPCVASGYVNRPELTAERFRSRYFFHTARRQTLSNGRSRPSESCGRNRVSRPHRHAGQNSRHAHRTGRDRSRHPRRCGRGSSGRCCDFQSKGACRNSRRMSCRETRLTS